LIHISKLESSSLAAVIAINTTASVKSHLQLLQLIGAANALQ